MPRTLAIAAPVLFLSGCHSVHPSPSDAWAPSESIRQDWLEKDREMIRFVRDLLRPPLVDAERFRGLANFDIDAGEKWNGRVNDDRDLGFGGHYFAAERWGGYCRCQVEVLSYQGRVVTFHVWCGSSDREDWALIRPSILAAWQEFGMQAAELGLRCVRDESEQAAAYKRALAAELGPLVPSDVPSELRRPYADLMNTMERTDVGEFCYYGGEPPWGRVAITALIEKERWDLIRNVLRGPNPEARIYAAEALLSPNAPITAADRETIARIRSLPIPISICRGCEVSDATAAKLLPAVDP